MFNWLDESNLSLIISTYFLFYFQEKKYVTLKERLFIMQYKRRIKLKKIKIISNNRYFLKSDYIIVSLFINTFDALLFLSKSKCIISLNCYIFFKFLFFEIKEKQSVYRDVDFAAKHIAKLCCC